jgi:hypothetical protein
MRSLVPVVLAAVLGGVIGSTFAEAGEPAVSGPAMCLLPNLAPERIQEAVNAHLAAGRTSFLEVSRAGGATAICAW